MHKIMGSWSGMRKYLEQDMLAECLRGRIRYGCTAYVGMDGCHIFELCLDGRQIKRFSWETVNSYFIENGYGKHAQPFGIREYWEGFAQLVEDISMQKRTEYSDNEFCAALEQYRNGDIQTSIRSADPLVRMFSVLDRRIGKRTLSGMKKDMMDQPDWLRELYRVRCEAEGI